MEILFYALTTNTAETSDSLSDLGSHSGSYECRHFWAIARIVRM
jgi:hypothetical protein